MSISVKKAVISVSNKSGVAKFASELREFGIEILSTGGTASLLNKNGIEGVSISDYTGFPEIMDGRVKTLHPKIYGGILARRDRKEHMDVLEEEKIWTIDMVVVNLYPFEETVSRECTFEEAIENIDIGGPAMLRAAAKNFSGVAVIVDPADYPAVIEELRSANGVISEETRFKLSQKAFDAYKALSE